ncbi:hypothetical protein CCMA1212_009138 [Trichoderma ghanense]|uniref:Uncharacterized protein n=1 Tax=Trichoderma ghanense TaxID=65468 RepID=A0ABY2GTK5_9HYPO
MVEPGLILPAPPSMAASAAKGSIGPFSSVGVSGSESSMGAGSSWRSEMAVSVEFLRSRQPRGLSASESLSMEKADGASLDGPSLPCSGSVFTAELFQINN